MIETRPVPVTMGSPWFRSMELDGFTVLEAWFPAGEQLERHTHDRACVAVMLEGSFDLAMGGRVHHCPPTAIATEPAGEPHANRIGSLGARVLVVQPNPARTELLQPFARMLDRPSHRHHAGVAGSAARLTRELDRPDDLSSLAVEAGVLEILVALGRLELDVEQGPPAWLLRAQELVHTRFREPLQVGEVARAVDVHPAHLARAFRHHFRMPLGSYVRRLRLDWAASRLAGSVDSLATVAMAAGFADQSHLTRAFKRHTGHTPGAYRRVRCRPS
jgi:AraC family transcriptional regulator